MTSFLLLPDIFVHHNRGSNTDIKTFHATKLGNAEALDIRVIVAIKTHAKTLVAEDKGAFNG